MRGCGHKDAHWTAGPGRISVDAGMYIAPHPRSSEWVALPRKWGGRWTSGSSSRVATRSKRGTRR